VNQEDLQRSLQRAKEAEAALEKERNEHTQSKVSIVKALHGISISIFKEYTLKYHKHK